MLPGETACRAYFPRTCLGGVRILLFFRDFLRGIAYCGIWFGNCYPEVHKASHKR